MTLARARAPMTLRTFTIGFQLALRASIAAGLSIGLARLAGLEYPLYAFLAAVIVTDLSPALSRELGLRRIAATVVGAICGATLSLLLPPSALGIGASILIAMVICQLVQVRDGTKVAGFICGIIVLDHSAEPWTPAFQRFIETVLGVVVAWAVSYVPKLIRFDEPDGQERDRQVDGG